MILNGPIDPVRLSAGVIQFHGPVSYRGSAYLLGLSDDTAAPFVAQIFKTSSLKSKSAWTALPLVVSYPLTGSGDQAATMAQDVSNPAVLHIAFVDAANNLNLIDFTMGPDTYSAVYGTIALTSANGGVWWISQRADGSLVVFYRRGIGAGLSNMFFNIWSGGAWLGETAVDTPAATYSGNGNMSVIPEAVAGGAGTRLHIFYEWTSIPTNPPIRLFYRSLSTGNALGAPFEFTHAGYPAIIGPSGSQFARNWGTGCVSNGRLLIPLIGAGPAQDLAAAFYGSPTSAPVFTGDATVDPFTAANGLVIAAPSYVLHSPSGSDFYFLGEGDTTLAPPANLNPTLFYSIENKNDGGGWVNKSLLFDLNQAVPSIVGLAPAQQGNNLSVALGSVLLAIDAGVPLTGFPGESTFATFVSSCPTNSQGV